MEPAYSMLPLTVLPSRRSHVASMIVTLPLTDPRSRPRAFSPFAEMLPLTLVAERSPSVVTPPTDTSPDTLFASSNLGVDAVITSPLTLSARTAPCTFESFTVPETDFTSMAADAGTATV